jgi:hypothetical protein
VHRSAFAAARAHRLAVDFAHHFLHIDALGDTVAVAAMRRGNAVAVVEMHHDAGTGGLFAGIKMHKARYVTLGELVVHPLLELANAPHRSIGLEQALLVERKWILAHRLSSHQETWRFFAIEPACRSSPWRAA